MNAVRPVLDPRTHRYSVGGRQVPGVTEVLAPLCDFSRVPAHVLKAAAHFGTAVHRACELDDLGQLEQGSLDARLAGHLQAWRAFCREQRVQWRLIEAPLYHASMGYAGTVDRFGTVAGRDAVVDLKTSSRLQPAVGPQLAAYQQAIDQQGVPGAVGHSQRLAVRLQADGRYEMREYASTQDWAVFASLLTLRQFCEQHRISPNFARPR